MKKFKPLVNPFFFSASPSPPPVTPAAAKRGALYTPQQQRQDPGENFWEQPELLPLAPPFTATNLDGADVTVRDTPAQGLSRQAVGVGDTVGFLDHEQRQRSGQIVRLNDKTVTLLSDGQKWRVAYAPLHRVIDATTADPITAQIIRR